MTPTAVATTPSPIPATLLARLARSDVNVARGLLRRVPAASAAAWAVQIADEVPRRARVSLDQGERLAFAAMTLARQTADPLVLARALRADGHRYALHAQYRRALGQYTRAAVLFETHKDAVQLAVTDSGSLQTLIYLGLYPRALRAAARARAIFRATRDRVRLARLESNVGNVYFRQDRFEKALACYRRAEAEMRALGEHQDVAIALRNIAVCLTSLNRFEESLATYRTARTYCAESGLRLLVAEADYNIAYLHYLCGDYDRALRAYAEARVQSDALGDRYHRTLCDLDEAEVCLELNDDAGACRRSEEAIEGFTALGMRYERAKAQTFLGTGLARQGEVAAALRSYRRARALFVADRNAAWVAMVDLARATVLLGAGRLREAALSLSRPAAALPPTARIVRDLLLARIALRRKEPRRARRAVAGAAQRLRQVYAPALEWQVHLTSGEVSEAEGDVAAAAASYRSARRALERLRARVSADELKVSFLADKLEIYQHLVRLAMTATNLDAPATAARNADVFRLVEDAKSRSLADLLAFRAGELAGRADAVEPANAVRVLRQETRAFERRLARESMRAQPDKPKLRKMQSAASGRERKLSAALAALHARDAGLAELQTGGSAPSTVVRAALPPDTTLIEYYVAGGVVYAIVLDAVRLEVTALGQLAEIHRVLQLLRFQLAKFQLGPDYVRTFSAALSTATHRHLQDLHDMLITPLLPQVRAKHLVIIPHGALHYLPFHALFDGRQYLMDRFTISYAPSAAVYRLCQTMAASPHSASLVLAVADGHAPHIRREAEEVSQALPNARTYLGEQATSAQLREAGPTSRFVHVAAHGFFRSDNPLLSAVRLAGGDVSLADLYTLTLDADLVTLSGCGTGLSAVVGGDELVGLMRGLLHAGARSVLLTMWQVDDFSTAEFMGRFYRLLTDGRSRADAVMEAMRAVRNRFPHPYYWAPFVLVGQSAAPAAPK